MPHDLTTIERAFQLAREGRCATIQDIIKTLKREKYDGVEPQMAGASVRTQLRQLIATARLKATE